MGVDFPFSNVNRSETLQKVAGQAYDLIVIGGGITGAGVSLDATARGLKVLLLEKGDFASGTSGKSTKLIHGGLRYLKQFDFWLVHEVGSERAIVHKLAPHLVLPEKMLLPLIEGGSYGKWLTSFGLKVYDILAEVDGDDKRRMLEAKEALKMEPLLPKKILKGAGYYAEYRTDDARLTLEVIKTGLPLGAQALNQAEVVDFLYSQDRVSGVKFRDAISGSMFEIASKYVINAAGPWVDGLRLQDGSLGGKRLHLTKGVHLVFPREKFPVRQSVYFDVPDGRMMFAIPRGKVTYIGTTDTNFTQDSDRVGIDITDAVYLITAVNHMFPDINLELKDIISSWAGLRPLIHEEGKSASELSRKDEIFTSKSGLVSIAGGKLTGYRKMAERAVNRIAKMMEEEHGRSLKACTTDKMPLCGSDFKKNKQVQKYMDLVFDRIRDSGFSTYDAWYLVTTYGKQTQSILELYAQIQDEDPSRRLIRAEARFAIAHEMALDPLDFFIRRTGRMYFDIESVRSHGKAVIGEFQQAFKLGKTAGEALEKALKESVRQHSDFSMDRI